MSYFCPECGWHPCRCAPTPEPDWRELDRQRIAEAEAAGRTISRCEWECHHMVGDRSHGYSGIGLVRNAPATQTQRRWIRDAAFVPRKEATA